MSSVHQFITDTHVRSKGSKLPAKSIGLKEAQAIADTVDWQRMAEIAALANKYLPLVQEELSLLAAAHAANPERVKLRAVLFGIATPNRDEAQSIGWALMAEGWFHTLSPMALAHRSYTSIVTGKRARMGLQEVLTRSIAAVHWSGVHNAPTLGTLESLPGCGPKVARMIQAVIDPSARNWTVDLWHMRQLLWASGREYYVKAVTGGKAYAVLENVWIDYADTFFPDVPTFAVQWATWCAAQGRFETHAPLWADLAPVC